MNKKNLAIVATIVLMLVAQLSIDARRGSTHRGDKSIKEKRADRRTQRGNTKRKQGKRRRGERDKIAFPGKRPDRRPGRPGRFERPKKQIGASIYQTAPAGLVIGSEVTTSRNIGSGNTGSVNTGSGNAEIEYYEQYQPDPIYEEAELQDRPE